MSERRSRVGQAVAWVVVAALGIWTVARVAGLERGFPFVQLMAFTPYVAVIALMVVSVLLALRYRLAASVAAVALLVLAACVLPRALRSPPEVAGPKLVVMSMNMRVGGADATQIAGLVRDRGVGVLVIQELTPDAVLRLSDAGLDTLLPYHQVNPTPGAGGSAVYARLPLLNGDVSLNPGGFLQSSGTIQVEGAAPIRVISVHPSPPANPGLMPMWSAGINVQPAADPKAHRILAGDFNSTLDHAELRRLIDTGYDDAATEVGKGLTPTWPFAGPRSAVTPKVTIDHILVDPTTTVLDFDAVTVSNTDHRAIIATLVLGVQVTR